MDIDHIVLWVNDVEQSLDFYSNVIGLEIVREKEFRSGSARFPSVRLNECSIIDIMESRKLLSLVQKFTGSSDDSGGMPINHICLSMSKEEYASISRRLADSGVNVHPGGENAFGAQGHAVRSTYFNDPDGNVIEIRYYDK
jgi:catechol 2,3-dioxygenase-like lactoylglutathione lyase family enzyme